MASDEYKRQFEPVFTSDVRFSRTFARHANAIVIRNLVEINDHEKRLTEEDCIKDSEGKDRSFSVPKTSYGVRVRRSKWVQKAEFTMDTKEWENSTNPDYYVFGYADISEKELLFHMLWDQRQFLKLAKPGKIKHGIEQNKDHSLVLFLTFKLTDIYDQCDILECGGNSPETIREILGDNSQCFQKSKLGEYQ